MLSAASLLPWLTPVFKIVLASVSINGPLIMPPMLDSLEQQGVIGAFDKRTIIDLSGDVIEEIAQKYKNVQKGIGGMMRGPLIETEARTILNTGVASAHYYYTPENFSHVKKCKTESASAGVFQKYRQASRPAPS